MANQLKEVMHGISASRFYRLYETIKHMETHLQSKTSAHLQSVSVYLINDHEERSSCVRGTLFINIATVLK